MAIRKNCIRTDLYCEVEFREAIARRIPVLNNLFSDWDQSVRRRAVELIGKLANHGERQLKHGAATDTHYEAELREAISSTIPSFIKLPEDKAWPVRLQSIDAIGKLVHHGERLLENIVAQLIRAAKPSFVKQSRA